MDLDALAERARALAGSRSGRGRALLGLTGPPGAGKSTLAEALVDRLAQRHDEQAVIVPMDGFHLHDDELARLGRGERKGAPDTFDVHGYLATLRRLHEETAHPVYVPRFDRTREESVAGAIAVLPEHRLVVTEGNYLLHSDGAWAQVRPLLDEVWFLDVDDSLRVDRLVARHVAHGRDPEQARHWATVSDQANAEVVAPTRERADLVVPGT